MVGMISDIGNHRSINEDYSDFYEDIHKCIYVIADGMGGHNAGEVASKLAVENIIEIIKNSDSIKDIQLSLKDAIITTNKIIFDKSQTNYSLSGMGTTITACIIRDTKMAVANVGDSSCFIIKNKKLIKITKDHSLVQQLIDEGSITKEQAFNHPNKNIITRALGTGEYVDVDIFDVDLCDVDKIMLCTDGLSNSVSFDEIYNIIINNDCKIACEKMVELSKLNGSRDNISVIIFEGMCRK